MKKRTVAICLCIILALGGIAATLAYFTDDDSAANTFTVGKVDISLSEADVKTDGELNSEDRVAGNEYHLIPGNTYIKDPTVAIEPKSGKAYVRMIVTVENYEALTKAFPNTGNTAKYYAGDVFLLQMLCNEWDSDTWQFEKAENGKYEFRYKETVGNETDSPVALKPLFESITVPGEIDNDNLAYLKNVKIHIDAHAIQAAGFDNADEAWAAFKAQEEL